MKKLTMLTYGHQHYFYVFLFCVIISFQPTKIRAGQDCDPDAVINQLDRDSVFSFAIMSDHKGLAPVDSERFAKMAMWIEKSGDRFVVGLGDHLKIGRPNTFLDYIVKNQWWNKNFYPNIADGENEFYGGSQGAWGKGGPLLTHIGLDKRAHIEIVVQEKIEKKETKEKAVVNDCSTCGGSGSDPERDPGEKSCQTCEGRGHGTGYKK